MDTQVGNCSSEGNAFFPVLKMGLDRLMTCTGLWSVSAPEELEGTSGTQGWCPEGKGSFLAWEHGLKPPARSWDWFALELWLCEPCWGLGGPAECVSAWVLNSPQGLQHPCCPSVPCGKLRADTEKKFLLLLQQWLLRLHLWLKAVDTHSYLSFQSYANHSQERVKPVPFSSFHSPRIAVSAPWTPQGFSLPISFLSRGVS